MPAAFVRLRIAGFKSFAEPVSLEILPGLTGIIGPNGCGKSNVVEALRWAMGENAARSLRGGEMDDVIFAGTAHRAARNLAEVSLVLEMTPGLAPPPWQEAVELHISRQIERGGGSVYRVNGKACRGRDVQTLLADLASGARSAAMVSQGRVGQLVNAAPDERRAILEEAAGITGLHARRREAELKLTAAEANLIRAEDLRAPLAAQFDGLQRQAQQAARYRALSAQTREAEAAYLAFLAARADAARDAAHTHLEDAAGAMRQEADSAAQALAAHETAERALDAPRAAESAARTVLERRRIEAEGLDEAEQRAAQALVQAQARHAQTRQDVADAEESVRDADETLVRLRAEETLTADEWAALPDRIAEAEAESARAQAESDSQAQIADQAAAEAAQASARADQAAQDVAVAEDRLRTLRTRQDALILEQRTAQADHIAPDRLEAADQACRAAADALAQAEQAVNEAEPARQAARRRHAHAQRALAEAEAERRLALSAHQEADRAAARTDEARHHLRAAQDQALAQRVTPEEIAALDAAYGEAEAAQRAAMTALDISETTRTEAAAAANAAQHTLAEAESVGWRVRETVRRTADSAARIAAQHAALRDEYAVLDAARPSAAQEEKAAHTLAQVAALLEDGVARLEEAGRARIETARLHDGAARAAGDAEAAWARAAAEAASLDKQDARVAAQWAALQEEECQASADLSIQTDLAQARDDLAAQEAALHSAQAQRRTAEAALNQAGVNAAAARAEAAVCETAAARLRAEIEGLSASLDTPGADDPTILDSLEIPPGLEAALDAALGETLDGATHPAAARHWADLPLLDNAPLPGGARPLSAVIDAPPPLRRALNAIGLLPGGITETEGAALQAQLQPGQVLVTLEGAVWRWDGFVQRDSAQSPGAARLERRSRLAALTRQMDECGAQSEAARAARDAAEQADIRAVQTLKDAAEAQRQADSALQDARARVAALETDAARAAHHADARRARRAVWEAEAADTRAQSDQLAARRAALPDLATLRAEEARAREAMQAARDADESERAQTQRCEQALRDTRAADSRFRAERAENEARRMALRPHIDRLQAEQNEAAAVLQAAETALAAAPDESRLRAALDDARQAMAAAEQAEAACRTARAQTDSRLAEVKAARVARLSRQEDIEARLAALSPQSARAETEWREAVLQADHAAQIVAALPDIDALRAEALATQAEEDKTGAWEDSARQVRRDASVALAQCNAAHAHCLAQSRAAEAKLAALIPQIDRLAAECDAADQALAAAHVRRNALPDPAAAHAALTTARTLLAEARRRAADSSAKDSALRQDRERLMARQAALAADLSAWVPRRAAIADRLRALEARRDEAAQEEALSRLPARATAQRDEAQAALHAAETAHHAAETVLNESESALRHAAALRRTAEIAAAAARESALRAEAARDQAEAALRAVAARIAERLGESPVLPPPPTALTDAAEERARRTMERLLREREAMGPVNLCAEAEAAALETRLAAMDHDRAELNAAITKLRGAISHLNREGRDRLGAVFARVDQHFQTLFARMFGGGKAHLALVGSDDPLLAGLEIFVQPPGKKLATLSLLSGGEQALTALSLIFAVFRCNPAPICVLDEVDAPLDDANVDRFCVLLADMVQETGTRFLVVTHHQHSMARMDRLYGVTMQERGVSKVLSVDLARAVAMVEEKGG